MEHIFYYTNVINATKINIDVCNLTGKVDFWEHLLHRERAHLFNVIPYSIWIVPLFQVENFAFSMSGTYIDILLISISIGISTRFWQLNERLKTDHISVNFISLLSLTNSVIACFLQIKTENEWLCIRQHYGALTDLVRKVNKHVSTLILLSCSNNLYFIVVYLFRSSTYVRSSFSTFV